MRIEDCTYINITDNDNTTGGSNVTAQQPIPPCPLVFTVRSSAIAGFDQSSHVKDCSKVGSVSISEYLNTRPLVRDE